MFAHFLHWSFTHSHQDSRDRGYSDSWSWGWQWREDTERQRDITREIMRYYISQKARGWIRKWLIPRKFGCPLCSHLKQNSPCMWPRLGFALKPGLMIESWWMIPALRVSTLSHEVRDHLDPLHKDRWYYCIAPHPPWLTMEYKHGWQPLVVPSWSLEVIHQE